MYVVTVKTETHNMIFVFTIKQVDSIYDAMDLVTRRYPYTNLSKDCGPITHISCVFMHDIHNGLQLVTLDHNNNV